MIGITETRDSTRRIARGRARSIWVETLVGVDRPACAVLGLHGGPGFTSASLRHGLGALAIHSQVLLVDLPGCGRSSRHPGSGYPIADYVDDVCAIVDDRPESRIVLLAHAWAAILAVEVARRPGSRIEAVILVNPLRILNEHGQDEAAQHRRVDAVDPSLVERFGALRDVIARARAGDTDAWNAPALTDWSKAMFATQFADKVPGPFSAAMRDAALGMESYDAYKGTALANDNSPWGRFDLRTRARNLVQPVLIVATDDDANYVAPPDRHALPLADSIGDAELRIVPGLGHFPFAEAPESFAGIVAPWIDARVR